MKYNLFNINNYTIDTSKFTHLLNDSVKYEFEKKFAEYVGASYACSASSASILLYIASKFLTTSIPAKSLSQHPFFLPSMLPPAVANIVHHLGVPCVWTDNVDWVGKAYTLFDANKAMKCTGCPKTQQQNFPKIIDSSQEVRRNQFSEDATPEDIMIFSFYPTKPVGGMDGGMMVTNDARAAAYFKTVTNLGNKDDSHNYPDEQKEQVEANSQRQLIDKIQGMQGLTDEERERILQEELDAIKQSKKAGSPQSKANAVSSWESKLLFPGWKAHANSAQCYVALRNLEKLDEKNKRLETIRSKYNDAFGLNNISNYLYRIDVEDRNGFMLDMESKGIQTGIHYHALHKHPFYDIICPPDMQSTESKAQTTVSLSLKK